MIAQSAVIYPNVKLGKNVIVEDFCIIGCPTRGETADNPSETVIGDNSYIRSHSVIYSGNQIGSGFQTGNKVNIREKNIIGNNVSIGTLSVVEHHVEIQDGVRIHTQAFVPEYSTLKKECWIGPNVVLTNALYPTSAEVKDSLKGPVIHEKAIIGANSTVLPGVVIGPHALVGAGSVVTKDVPEAIVVAGNPAKEINKIKNLPYKKSL